MEMAKVNRPGKGYPMCTPLDIYLVQCFSKCGPQTSSISITWESVRKADSQAPPADQLNRNLWGWGLGQAEGWGQLSRWFEAH